MKKLFIKFSILLLIIYIQVFTYIMIGKFAAQFNYGINTYEQINESFKNAIKKEYNCYFLGNSRIYRGINPDKINSIECYNFGHDNDSYNQIYYKILYLLQNNKNIRCLLIGTDYFQFSFLSDTRSHIYSQLFPKRYIYDFKRNSFSYWPHIIQKNYRNIQDFVFNDSTTINILRYFFHKPISYQLPYLKDNGQYITYGNAKGTEKEPRDYTILNIQYEYFLKIIKLCEKEKINLFVIMPPLWKAELYSHSENERIEFNKMILNTLSNTSFSGHYLNYSEENGISEYTDFTDTTHLNSIAADKYSEYIDKKILSNIFK
ncbi:hypothetical protein [Treponema sp. C6A8]|uniref:hypothetical protein n=1 Tax=Treponema sp. C6A8 TaxID=1410609 RepID=UPI0004801204|nr:hypothetical protein [Treponema sp. C6A8]